MFLFQMNYHVSNLYNQHLENNFLNHQHLKITQLLSI